MYKKVFSTLMIIIFLFAAALADNWPQWRGPFLNGVSNEKNLPLRWSKVVNVAWKVNLPGLSAATPVVWGDSVFLNVTERKEIYLWCVERKQGRLLWKKLLGRRTPELNTHPKHNPSTPSPVTDGKNVYVLNAYGSLVGFDLAGNKIWKRELWQDYGQFILSVGFSSSPVLYENSLYLQVLRVGSSSEPSYLLRINKNTGKTVWKKDFPATPRFKPAEAYSTPTILKNGRSVELIVNGSDQVTGHDINTGQELWRMAGLSPENPPFRVVSSPVVADGIIYAPAASRPLIALRAGGRGNLTRQLWSSRNGPDVPSPLTDGKYFYIVHDNGVMRCLDAKTGKEVWGPKRLKPGSYSSSPVLADQKIYVVNEDGVTSVLKAGPNFELIAENSLDDLCLSSPAISDGQIFIRTARFLYCIGKRAGPPG
ncbi:MAG TPA: PQQ-binding-like beta-propeller repeat protein [Candidatus Angelobacter sp.]|nr:PQQ-binding-like beta-propeller repeat protein [Candidatus Angelobacter sp.]